MRYGFKVAAAIAALPLGSATNAADHQVQMLNKGEKSTMVLQPSYVVAAFGGIRRTVPSGPDKLA